jgi:hypothetical protein
LIAKGFNPCDWFVPCQDILFIAYQCALQGCWGGTFAYSIASYHSSTEVNAICQCGVFFDCASQGFSYKCNTCWVRAFRCIIL